MLVKPTAALGPRTGHKPEGDHEDRPRSSFDDKSSKRLVSGRFGRPRVFIKIPGEEAPMRIALDPYMHRQPSLDDLPRKAADRSGRVLFLARGRQLRRRHDLVRLRIGRARRRIRASRARGIGEVRQ
jgi:hypothetical protein